SSQSSVVVPGAQPPSAQASPMVHTLLSSQGSVFGVLMQPLAALHASSVQRLSSSQSSMLAPALQLPPPQRSPTVQRSASSQGRVLLVTVTPAAASQLTSVQTLPSLSTTGVPRHAPSVQRSNSVQAFPSEQG